FSRDWSSDVCSSDLGEAAEAPELIELAALVREAAELCPPEGRPLFAAHADLPWPDGPVAAVWHGATLLREFRGDGHVAALVAEEIGRASWRGSGGRR